MTFFRMEMVRDKLEKMKKFWQVSRREGDDAPAVGHFVFTGSPGKFFRDKIFGQVSFLNNGYLHHHFGNLRHLKYQFVS